MRTKYRILIRLIGLLISGLITINAFQPLDSNNNIADLKAAFVYNFTRYVMWPQIDKSPIFIIGILGKDEIISSFQQMAEKKLVGNLPIQIRHYESLQDVKYCHILFIAESEKNQLDSILNKVAKRNILTIGDTAGFCKRGVMINFFIQNDMIKFEMNPAKMESSGLKASSQLLKLARIIE